MLLNVTARLIHKPLFLRAPLPVVTSPEQITPSHAMPERIEEQSSKDNGVLQERLHPGLEILRIQNLMRAISRTAAPPTKLVHALRWDHSSSASHGAHHARL